MPRHRPSEQERRESRKKTAIRENQKDMAKRMYCPSNHQLAAAYKIRRLWNLEADDQIYYDTIYHINYVSIYHTEKNPQTREVTMRIRHPQSDQESALFARIGPRGKILEIQPESKYDITSEKTQKALNKIQVPKSTKAEERLAKQKALEVFLSRGGDITLLPHAVRGFERRRATNRASNKASKRRLTIRKSK